MVKGARLLGVLTALIVMMWLAVNPVNPILAASGRPHIMVVMMENQGYSDIIGNSSAPYMNRLASTYEAATNYSAVGHYSLDNYLAAVSGNFDAWSTGDCSPGPGCQSSDPTIATQLDAAGIPWAAYMGGMTTNCETSDDGGSGGYGVRHDPFVYYPALVSSDCAKIRPAGKSANWSAPTAMNRALNSSSPPDFVWFSPSICDDAGQDAPCASIAAGDRFLSTEIPKIQRSSWYQAGGEIVLTFDESSSGSQGEDTSAANRVLTILVSAGTQGHASLTSYVNHFGLLAGLEQAYGLPCLASACQTANGVLPLASSGPPPTTTTTTTQPVATTSTTVPSGPLPEGPGGSWNMVFDDEFSGNAVDTAKWSYCYPWGACNNAGNDELEWYQSQNVTEGEGVLSLTAEKQTAHGFGYTSGLIQTDGKFDYQYGYAEIRAELPSGQGMWPAFWMLPTSQSWPPEIDAVEQYQDPPDDVTLTVHYGTSSNPRIDQFDYIGPDFQSGWHVYGVDWEPTGVTWYIDGHAVFHSSQVIDEQMYVLLNLAVAGDPAPNAQTPFPSSFQVDYVRVWQH